MNTDNRSALDHDDPFSMVFLQKKIQEGYTVLIRRNASDPERRRASSIRRATNYTFGSDVQFVSGYYSIAWELNTATGWVTGITLTTGEAERASIKKGLDAEGKEAIILCLNLQDA